MFGRKHTEVDINPTLEQPPQNLDNLRSCHVQLARQRQSLGDMLRILHRLAHPLLEKGQLGALRNGMANRQLNHVIAPRQQGNHIVEHPRPLQVLAVLKVELLRLEIALLQGSRHE